MNTKTKASKAKIILKGLYSTYVQTDDGFNEFVNNNKFNIKWDFNSEPW